MNFLAHIYLSGNNEELMVGNFIGDFVKGNQLDEYSPSIQQGIRLHRAVDYFTDTHDIVLQSKKKLREKYRHYAPVIVDVYYDHFLAKNWSQFSSIPLKEYTHSFYETMTKYQNQIPKGVIHMLNYMSKDNWLFNYQFIEGMDKALTGMSKRTKFDSKMEEASGSLEEYYDEFSEEFFAFFPELENHVKEFLK
ncbi:MAG: ACP phosphodiesterase [Ekhidna sp.]